MLIALTALLVAANLIFAARELNVVRRSRASISTRTPAADLPSLSIIVPARNEQRQIERCLRSLLATRHPRYEVIVVDDQSTDETRAIADRIAASETRFTVVAGAPLPEGWVGKPWALAQGARVARGAWLLFTDADTEHHPLAAAAALDCALNGGYDAVSLLTQQLTAGIAERLFLPTILLVIMLGVGALDDVNDPRKRDVALFNGQYILVSRRAYDAIGGHAAVRGEIAEDLELARLFKRDGRFRTFLAACDGLVRTRMYRSFGELWQGFVKNFGLAARGHAPEVIAGVALLTCVSIVSPALLLVLVLNHAWIAAVALALSMASIVAIAESGMRAMRFRPGSGLALPLGLALTLAIFGTSLFLMRCGGGVAWRGRRYGGVFRQPR
ncbi:MAG TPA: glycosyltransferase family 2 protein [Candidatus Babeliales bacterium]|nr:glycosyltransferase family 2 protein [Candidatus Babeliales bacterium]